MKKIIIGTFLVTLGGLYYLTLMSGTLGDETHKQLQELQDKKKS